MVAVAALDELGNLVLSQSLRAVVELGDHLTLGEGIAVRVVGQAGILAVLVHQRVEVLACVDAVEDGLRFLLRFLIGALGLAGSRVNGRDQDVLCGDVVILVVLLNVLIRRGIDAVLAEIVIVQRLIALADIHEVLVGLVRKTELRDLVQISVLGGVRDAVAANGRHLLLLVVAELEAELVELLHDDARIDRLLLRRLRHGSAERLGHVLVRPQVGQTHLRIHARVILHVVEHVARVFVGSYCIAVYGQHGLRAFVQRLIVDHHARHAADGRAQYNGGHGNHCSKTLY